MAVPRRWITRTSLTGLILLTLAAGSLQTTADPADRSSEPSLTHRMKPKELSIDPDFNVGKHKNNELRKFIRKMDKNVDFRTSIGFVMKSRNGDDGCELFIRVASGTYAIERKKDSANPNGFILGLITNPNGCMPLAFSLGPKDTAAWWGRYTSPTVVGADGTPAEGVGRTGLILLERNGGSDHDEWLPMGRRWTMGYCNHSSQGNTDQALVLAYSERCSGPQRYEHNAAAISQAMLKAARDKSPVDAYRLLPGANDLALWFACGGDCCYSSFEQY